MPLYGDGGGFEALRQHMFYDAFPYATKEYLGLDLEHARRGLATFVGTQRSAACEQIADR